MKNKVQKASKPRLTETQKELRMKFEKNLTKHYEPATAKVYSWHLKKAMLSAGRVPHEMRVKEIRNYLKELRGRVKDSMFTQACNSLTYYFEMRKEPQLVRRVEEIRDDLNRAAHK
jgi:hypothetical protein